MYFLLTVYQLFTTEPDTATRLAVPPAHSPGSGHFVLESLAQARITLAVDPYLASTIIRDTRRTLSNLTDNPEFVADIELQFFWPQASASHQLPG
jgi:hypothetical protein